MGSTSAASGREWEEHAAAFLSSRGLEVLARRFRCRLGELDLICKDGAALVIVEVRARRNSSRGSAAETVGRHKRARILQATRYFLMLHPDCLELPLRFDVVAIDRTDDAEPAITWIRDAFGAA